VTMEVNHYYPYGALMGESQNTTTQPYKYNGKELDRSFGLDWYDYGVRWMDGVGGRWSSMDPLCEKYYDVSPYAYCAGNPVNRIDPDGNYIAWFDETGKEWKYDIILKSFIDISGNKYEGSNQFIISVSESLNKLLQGKHGYSLVSDLVSKKEGIQIIENRAKCYESNIGLSPFDSKIQSGICFCIGQDVYGGTDYTNLAHELAHSQDRLNGTMDNNKWFIENEKVVTNAEIYSMHIENLVRAEQQLPLRKYYVETSGDVYSIKNNSVKSLYFDRDGKHLDKFRKLPNDEDGYVYKVFH